MLSLLPVYNLNPANPIIKTPATIRTIGKNGIFFSEDSTGCSVASAVAVGKDSNVASPKISGEGEGVFVDFGVGLLVATGVGVLVGVGVGAAVGAVVGACVGAGVVVGLEVGDGVAATTEILTIAESKFELSLVFLIRISNCFVPDCAAGSKRAFILADTELSLVVTKVGMFAHAEFC